MLDREIVTKIKNEYGTPVFVFDENEVRCRAQKIKEILNTSSSTEVRLCYSIKANPFLIAPLMDVVDNYEVCSPGELEICIDEKVPAGKIIYSGVHKEYEDIKRAIEYGAGVLTCESLKHYEIICVVADELSVNVDVLLRLNSKSQFGMSLDDIKQIIGLNNERDNVEIVGIHYFAGTQRAKLKHQRKELDELKDTITGLRDEYGIKLPRLEYGPGFCYPYFEGDDFTDTLLPAKEFEDAIAMAASWSELTIEMGRFLASSCGYYITSVCDAKKAHDHNWCIIDGGINHVNYLGQMMGLKVPIMKCISENGQLTDNCCADAEADIQEWSICGSLCTTNDVLVRSYKIKSLNIGDILVFENLGAYSITEGLNLFLSRQMPKVIMLSGDKITLKRNIIETWRINCGRIN